MLSRRAFCNCASLALFASTTTRATGARAAECAVMTSERQQAVTPDNAITRLKAGNDRLVSGKTINCDLIEQVKGTATSQAPFAAIVGCIDSRVPPELVFDQRIGDVFCARGRQLRQHRHHRQSGIRDQSVRRARHRGAGP